MGDSILKLEHLYQVLEVSKVGSISRAAENLYISQPYLSKCIRDVEDIIGLEIFKRSSKGVAPTEAGKEFIRYSAKIVNLIRKINNLKNKHSKMNKEFTVISMPSFTILDLLYNFESEYSEELASWRILYKEMPNTYVAENVKRYTDSIGFIYISSTNYDAEIKTFEKMSLEFVPLIKEPLSAIVSRNNKLYDKKEVSLADLDGLKFLAEYILLTKGLPPIENNPLPEVFCSTNKNSLMFNNNRSMLYYLTKRNDCFCIGQKSLNLTNPLVCSNDIRYIPIKELDVSFSTGYLTNKNAINTNIEERFIKFIYDFFYPN